MMPFEGKNMSTPLRGKKGRRGFTLIEMAFVLVIIGIMISLGSGMLPMLVKHNKFKENQAIIREVKTALIGYAFATGKLPCADRNEDGLSDNNRYRGYLPYETIGVKGTDPYTRTLFYAVDEHLTSTSNIAELSAHLDQLIASPAPNPSLYCAPTNTMPAAFIVFSGGENLSPDPPNDDNNNNNINNGDDIHFEEPGSPVTDTYDDILDAEYLTVLRGRLP